MNEIEKVEQIIKTTKNIDKTLAQISAEYDIEYENLTNASRLLLSAKNRAAANVEKVERLINTIARTPKSFEKDFKEINNSKNEFKDIIEYGKEQVKEIKSASAKTVIGTAAGLGFANSAPSAAMWVATTFGRTSAHKAICQLSGAAAKKAALAWLGGGAISAGGGGIAAGQAFLALAGPIGWGITGVTFLASVLSLWKKSIKAKEEKARQILKMMECVERTRETTTVIVNLKTETNKLNLLVQKQLKECSAFGNKDYREFEEDAKNLLGALVNNTKTLSKKLTTTVE